MSIIERPKSRTASNAGSTTLRPRNRRRTHDDESNAALPFSATAPNWLDGPAVSSSSLGAVFPGPSTHDSRTSQTDTTSQISRSNSHSLGVPSLSVSQTIPSTFASSLWESSWSSLQGIASNFIGTDISRASSPALSSRRRRRPLDATHDRNTSAPPTQWGPSGGRTEQAGAGTNEDRKVQVQAKKRENLLAANGHITPDISGRYKRRDSDDSNPASAPPGELDDRDAMVYVHKVRPEDTLAGVMIKYGCQPNVFRQANRLWPNDSIQVRKIVILPIDACGVKGRRISEQEDTASSFGYNHPEDMMPTPTALHSPWGELHPRAEDKQTPIPSISTSPSISISLSNPEELPWKHDSWVTIDGFLDAVEIARLPRKMLGYFPRSRRKSLTFSDLETPPASFDLPRATYQSTSPRGLKTKSRSSSGSYFPQRLQGPGGVGTMSRDVRSPGPAQDGLNKLFAAHLPNVAPRTSFESASSSSHGNGLENVGGAIEGWVRKLASKAAKTVQPPRPGATSGASDLIEMSEDAFEIGSENHEDSESRRNTIPSESAGSGTGSWSAEQEQMLQDQYPPRGRAAGDKPRRGKSD